MFATAEKRVSFDATAASLDAVYPAICIDIETGFPDPSYIEKRLEKWKPRPNTKEENIEAKRQEARNRIIKGSALLDGAPITCIALVSEHQRVILNGMSMENISIQGWQVLSLGDEKNMLDMLRIYLEMHTDASTMVIGHRITEFDLPKLRRACTIHRMKIPQALRAPANGNAQPVHDTARLFKFFSTEVNTDFISLEEAADYFGVEHAKGICNGELAPLLAKQGKTAEVLNYCATDAAATFRIWQLMTGQAPDLQ